LHSAGLFDFKVEPFAHQLEEYLEARDLPARHQLWEQGTAKTKVVIDTGAHLYLGGKINTVLIVAPNGVDENWVTDQIPEHLPEAVARASRVVLYRPERNQTEWHKRELRQAIYHDGLLWLVVPYDTFVSKFGKKLVWEVLDRRRCLYVLDESSDIKTPSAKRTISVIASGKYAPYRRILEGTPVTLAPFDVYSQVRFLDQEFWKRELEIGTAVEFRQYFGMYRKREKKDGTSWEECVGYRRIDQLQALLKKLGRRVVKKEVLPDLPEKLYGKRYFRLEPGQRRVYDELKKEFMATLPSGGLVTTQLPIVQLLRLQQIACGYVPVDDPTGGDDPQPVEMLCERNPRLETLEAECSHIGHQGIIWARFHKDVDLITDMLGARATRYDGLVGPDDKQRNKEAFLAGERQWMVANPQAMARGHTFINALTTIYYNNSFRLRDRLQSEDRNHRAGQKNAVMYVDIVASDTVDNRILQNLRRKHEVAAMVTGDELREWI
jgi:SNF2 family DNA or RNA helicase